MATYEEKMKAAQAEYDKWLADTESRSWGKANNAAVREAQAKRAAKEKGEDTDR